jgi:RNA polymerase sigma factor (sigma-70 family)
MAYLATEHTPYVLVVDDHPLVARGLAHFLRSASPASSVVSVTRWSEALALVRERGCPSVMVADVWLGDDSSLAALGAWREACPDTPWLAISGDDNPGLQAQVRDAGAQGFVHKQESPELFAQAFQTVLRGEPWFAQGGPAMAAGAPAGSDRTQAALAELTPRQNDILALILRGLPNKRIGSELGISESTVKEHVSGILDKLGLRTRVEVITLLHQRRQGREKVP